MHAVAVIKQQLRQQQQQYNTASRTDTQCQGPWGWRDLSSGYHQDVSSG
jgi:hypothetical protein